MDTDILLMDMVTGMVLLIILDQEVVEVTTAMEEEMETITTVAVELQTDQTQYTQTLIVTLQEHRMRHQDLKTQLQDPKTLHQEKALIPQEPIRNHLEHHHLEIIALLQEVIITHHQEVHQEEVLVEEVSEAEAEVVLAAEAEEAEEVK